jgi:hypothetical protein
MTKLRRISCAGDVYHAWGYGNVKRTKNLSREAWKNKSLERFILDLHGGGGGGGEYYKLFMKRFEDMNCVEDQVYCWISSELDDLSGPIKQNIIGYWILLESIIVQSVPCTAAIFWSIFSSHLSPNHSWFIHQSCLAIPAETPSIEGGKKLGRNVR